MKSRLGKVQALNKTLREVYRYRTVVIPCGLVHSSLHHTQCSVFYHCYCCDGFMNVLQYVRELSKFLLLRYAASLYHTGLSSFCRFGLAFRSILIGCPNCFQPSLPCTECRDHDLPIYSFVVTVCTGCCVVQSLCLLPTQFICWSVTNHTVNEDYFRKQH
jgi:hypothetical protein